MARPIQHALAPGAAILALLLGSVPARAEVDHFEDCAGAAFCQAPTPLTIGGQAYIQRAGLMVGTTTVAGVDYDYSAPINLLYPADPRKCSRTGIVDLVNNSVALLKADGLGFVPGGAPGRLALGDDYLGRRGHVWAALQMQRFSTFGDDTIRDGIVAGYYPGDPDDISFGPGRAYLPPVWEAYYHVIDDAADFVRTPSDYGVDGACDSPKAIALGYSQSAAMRRGAQLDPDLPQSYDGTLNIGIPGTWACDQFPAGACPMGTTAETPQGSGKTLTVNHETDVMLLHSQTLRADTPWYKVYEIAGVSHAPTEIVSLAQIELIDLVNFGVEHHQNPARNSPVVRTMMDDLIAWIDGTATPPPSVYVDTSGCAPRSAEERYEITGFPTLNDEVLDWECPGVRDPDRGNALPGGIRLPHVVTDVNGELVGAPLGLYGGFQQVTPYWLTSFLPPSFRLLPNVSGAIVLGGSYVRFTDEELTARYGTYHQDAIDDTLSGSYLGKVASAANYAQSKGWISDEEKQAYIATAQACAKGKVTSLDYAALLTCHGY